MLFCTSSFPVRIFLEYKSILELSTTRPPLQRWTTAIHAASAITDHLFRTGRQKHICMDKHEDSAVALDQEKALASS